MSHFVPCEGCNSSFSSDKSLDRAIELRDATHARTGCNGKPRRDAVESKLPPLKPIRSRR